MIWAKVSNDGVFLPYKSAYAEKVYELIVGCVVACTRHRKMFYARSAVTISYKLIRRRDLVIDSCSD